MGVQLCYVDESGDAETLNRARPDGPPVFVLVGMTVPASRQRNLIMDFLRLKKEFEPRLAVSAVRLSEIVNVEIKGSKLRKDLRNDRASRNTRRRAVGFIDKSIRVLEDHGCQVFGKVIVKSEGRAGNDTPTYAQAIAEMATTFDAQLAASGSDGIMILDARTKVKNESNVHGITTRRFRANGGSLHHLLEAPVFGHSNTHVPLQLVDIIASAVIFPMACLSYCSDLAWNAHPHDRYSEVKERFGARMQHLEYRYVDDAGVRRGGFQVIDQVQQRPTHLLFRDA